ncbi:hypothetical protein VMCG_10893 [Cytospora schulzeri]|uniref:DUF6604 domain-containing protein n=1 Tax=Cytospora schulzeri TaxID=448051 RepID=A0A423V7M0_9PEZI|nr:hypothetical protein VMCG_10893 [Valsa malicola]
MSTPSTQTSELLSTYKQYKADTEAIAGWLAETSTKCGGSTSTVPAAPPTSTRLKGKARKQAKEAAKAGAASKPHLQEPPKYTIRVSDFTTMAKTIAEFGKPKIKVPRALFNLFDRAIGAREKFNEWFERTSHDASGSNQRHRHFVGILRSTYEILHPFSEVKRAQKKANPGGSRPEPASSIPALGNRFMGLKVDDLDHVPENEHSGNSDPGGEQSYRLPDVGRVAVVRDEDEIEVEFCFAILSFCLELNVVRDYVRKVWGTYLAGVMELMQASVLTNTAVHLVRELEQQLGATVERPKKYPEHLYPVWCFPAIVNWICHDLKDHGHKMDDYVKLSRQVYATDCEHGKIFFFDTFFALKATVYDDSIQSSRTIVPDLSELYTDLTDTHRRVFSMFPLINAAAATVSPFANDEITRGVETMFNTHSVPIWAAFGIQLLLDIEDVELGARSVPGHHANKIPLVEVKNHVQERLQELNELHLDDLPMKMATKATIELDDIAAEAFKRIEDEVLKDTTGEIIRRVFKRPQPKIIVEPDAYLKRNPVRCGMLKLDLYLQLHRRAFQVEVSWLGITSMVHLYLACRQVFPEDPVWPDMEHVLGILDLEHTFFGGIPQSMEEAERKFCLALGVVPSSMARDSRSKGVRFEVRRARLLSNPSTLDSCFEKWSQNSLAKEQDLDDWVSDLKRRIHDPVSLRRAARQVNVSEKKQAILCTQWSDQSRTIPEMLNTLAVYPQYEAGDIHFGWLALHQTTGQMWRKIAACVEETDGEHHTQLPFLVLAILEQAREVESIARKTKQAREVESIARKTKQDGPALLKSSGSHLAKAWEIIKSSFMTLLGGVVTSEGQRMGRVYVGDQELMNLLSRHWRDSFYPNANIGPHQRELYKNWPTTVRQTANWKYMYLSYLYKQAIEAKPGLGIVEF